MPFKDPEKRKQYHREYAKKWNRENRERYLERIKKWQNENKDKTKQYQQKYYRTHREQEIIRCIKGNAKRYRQYRLDALVYYGGNPPKCACCKKDILEFLCIDHINKNGAQHRKEMKKKYSWGIYEFLKRNNYPKGYRVLCYNCNSSIGHYGFCPHDNDIS